MQGRSPGTSPSVKNYGYTTMERQQGQQYKGTSLHPELFRGLDDIFTGGRV